MARDHSTGTSGLATSRRALLIGLGTLFLDVPRGEASGPPAERAELPLSKADAERARPFLGAFAFAGGPKERAALARAIEEIVQKFSPIVRGIARQKITETNPIAETISFAADARVMTTRFDARALTAPLDGRKAKVRAISGELMEMSYRFGDGELVQSIEGDEKGQINRFYLREPRVVMGVRVYASQLPQDLAYTLTYERS